MPTEIVYKIKDTATGLFSTGGYHPAWFEVGTPYSSKGTAVSQIKLYMRGQYPGERKKMPSTWEVVEVMVTHEEVKVWSVKDLLKGYKPPPEKKPAGRRKKK